MRIIVCIKQVPETSNVRMDEKTGTVIREGVENIINPLDLYAIEVALELKDKHAGNVTVITMGPPSAQKALREAMAMGCDDAVLISHRAFAGSDTHATSYVLSSAIKKLAPFDLVLFGTRTADSDTGQVGPQTAVLLDLPLVTWSCSIERKEAGLVVERRADGFAETFELSFPAALTIHPAWVQARDLGLAGLQTAFEEQDITTWTLADIGLSPDQVGEAGSPTRLLSLSRADRARKCEFVEGTSEEQADELVRRLLESGLIA